MSSSILTSYMPYLADLADDWLSSGATAFSLWSCGQPVACWPTDAAPSVEAIVAPIKIGRRVVGELRVAGAGKAAQCWLNAEARLLGQIARLDDELQQMTSELIDAQDQLVALYDLTQSTRNHIGISDTMRSIVYESARLLRAEGAVMLLKLTLIHYPAPLIDDVALLDYFHQVQASGCELVLNVDGDREIQPGLHSACFVPIRVRDTVSAMLGLFNKSGGQFGAPDLKLARTIAEHAGVQIEHALLYQDMLTQTRLQTEMELARNVQARLLPQQRPRVAGVDLYAESRSAFLVGGDFYDFVQQDDYPLTFMLGDVVGKGVSAALIMGMVHTITHSAARFIPTPTPAAIISRANEHLYDNFTILDAFATAFVAQYQMEERTLVYANAGHAPVIFCPVGGPARLLEADGVPIGVLPMSLSEDERIPFIPGDLLIIATDGFNEASNPFGEMFGYERLLRLAEEWADKPVQVIAQALYDAVESFAAGQPRSDDQTLIVLKGGAA